MALQIPAHDPGGRGSLVERTRSYVRGQRVLQWALVLTCINHLVAILFVVLRWVPIETAGFLVLMSVLTWFFAVALPVMNREVRISMGAARSSYWNDLVERFARVVLYAQTLMYTASLASLASVGN